MATRSTVELFGILIIILTYLCKWGITSNAGVVDTCPDTEAAWKKRASRQSTSCGGRSVYHCLQDEDGKKREVCVEKSLLNPGYCPLVTHKNFVDWNRCNLTTPGCPNTTYISDEVYKFPFCFGDNTPSPIKQNENGQDIGPGAVAGIVFAVLVLLLLSIFLLFIMYRRSRGLNYVPKDVEGHPLMPTGNETSRREVVKAHHVMEGMAVLKKHDSLLITGKLGTAVTSTADSIMNEFARKNDGWKTKHCKYQELPVRFDPKTIYFVYGWFGLWNDNPCDLPAVILAFNTLTNAHKGKKNKFIIGMRSDVNKKYASDLEQFEDNLLHYSISLDTVNFLRDKGYEDYLNDKVKGVCQDKSCKCKSLKFDMLTKEKENKIGIPLKMNILENHHNLIAEFVKRKNIKETLKEHFKSLKDTDGLLYQCLMYVCLKGEHKRSADLEKGIVKKLKFEISKKSFEQNMPALEKYIRMKNSEKQQGIQPEAATYVFWHPFIYICAFHTLFESNPDEVMTCCNMDAILQLVRPESTDSHKKDYFIVLADQERVKLFQKRVKDDGMGEALAGHPLLKFKVDGSPGES
ncbi:uncharacterized protein LOC133204829 [Saccostrea echinata]|uniref:uncharacterized protein LOC133204829 n=1 Tax=Saccostrea echinata TaxID=191078 RepID=UPI002A813FDB|nr:uncharacterized protein LOC133204829 [Saccostrea echinata]